MSVKAKVRCAGISYAVKSPLLDSDGEQVVNDAGVKQFSVERREALLGEEVELSDHEFALHEKLGGVQRADDPTPLPGSPGQPIQGTPFTMPVPGADGETKPWVAPVMGHPAPAGAGLTDTELLRGQAGQALTAEQIAEYEREAAASAAGSTDETLPDIDVSEASADEIAEYIQEHNLNVDATVDLAGDDPEYAEKVLEAESQSKDRVGVHERLQRVIDSAEDEEE